MLVQIVSLADRFQNKAILLIHFSARYRVEVCLWQNSFDSCLLYHSSGKVYHIVASMIKYELYMWAVDFSTKACHLSLIEPQIIHKTSILLETHLVLLVMNLLVQCQNPELDMPFNVHDLTLR